MPKETVLAAYQAIFPGVHSILQCLIVFNMPFTFIKAMISVVITFLIYNSLTPVFKMSRQAE
jgi:precorrin-2 methylase